MWYGRVFSDGRNMRSGDICQGKVGRSPTHAVSVNPDQRRNGENRGVFGQQFGRRGKACIRVKTPEVLRRGDDSAFGRRTSNGTSNSRFAIRALRELGAFAGLLLGFGWSLAGD